MAPPPSTGAVFKVTFQMVNPIGHPQYYWGENPRVSASEVAEEHWHTVEVEFDDRGRAADRVDGLNGLAGAGHLIRNVKMFSGYRAAVLWEEVTDVRQDRR